MVPAYVLTSVADVRNSKKKKKTHENWSLELNISMVEEVGKD